MKIKKITMQYSAENDIAFQIENEIRASFLQIIKKYGGRDAKIELENMLVPNPDFELKIVPFLNK